MEPLQQTIEVYHFLQNVTDNVFPGKENSLLEIPINEIPLLLEAMDEFIDDFELTDRELASKLVYYAHYMSFRRSLSDSNELVSSYQVNGSASSDLDSVSG